MINKPKKRRSKSVDSLIGNNSQIIGDFRFSGGLHVDGTVKGNVLAEDEQSMLTLSERGTIEGEVKVPHIVLNGVVRGDVYAGEHVELAPQARVEGNVHYRLIEMSMGAEVNGKLLRIPDEESAPLALGHGAPELAE